jgi:hypothetical protein
MSDAVVREGLQKISSLLQSERAVVVFVGAGMSVRSGLPTWSDLVRHLTENLESVLPDDEMQEFLKRAEPASVIDLYAQHFGRDEVVKMLSGALLGPIVPSEAHSALAAIPLKAVITTNFDSLIEQSLTHAHKNFEVVTSAGDLDDVVREDRLPVIKLHGSIDKPSTLVLTESAYLNAVENSAIDKYVRLLLSANIVLFLGVSPRDPEILNLYDRYKGGPGRDATWIYAVPKVSELERYLWARRGIVQIEIPSDRIAEFLVLVNERLQAPPQPASEPEGKRKLLLVGDAESRKLVDQISDVLRGIGVATVSSWESHLTSGQPVLEKLDKILSTVAGAIVILGSAGLNSRAAERSYLRDNVLLELGFLMGKLGRKRILVLTTGDVKLPTDLLGIDYLFVDEEAPRSLNAQMRRWTGNLFSES